MKTGPDITEFLPMSETAYYMLLALKKTSHGYGVILEVEKMTNGRLQIGAGTIYGTLTRFEKDGIIIGVGEKDRRKLYEITDIGNQLLKGEVNRIGELYENGKTILKEDI